MNNVISCGMISAGAGIMTSINANLIGLNVKTAAIYGISSSIATTIAIAVYVKSVPIIINSMFDKKTEFTIKAFSITLPVAYLLGRLVGKYITDRYIDYINQAQKSSEGKLSYKDIIKLELLHWLEFASIREMFVSKSNLRLIGVITV